MILTKKVIIKIHGSNKKHYLNKNYIVKKGVKKLEVFIKDLPLNSHVKIKVECDKCKTKKMYIYQAYNKYTKNQTIDYYCVHCNSDRIKESFEKRFGEGITNAMHVKKYKKKQKHNLKNSITKEVIDKRKLTNLEKYGFNSPCENEKIKQKLIITLQSKSFDEKEKINKKREKTNLKRYGVVSVNQLESVLLKSKKTRIKNGNQISDELLTEFEIYRKIVTSFTNNVKKHLFKRWNGYDFYDGENIKENLLLDKMNKNYPTIDHKISVLYGFLNNIAPKKIAEMKNLCITKRSINSKKSSKNFIEIK